jgi:hypothetical protein
MSRWFRMYADAHRNPKVARLSDRDYRTWTILLSIASENDGRLPPLEDLKHLLRMRLDHLSSALDRLVKGGLIDLLEQGYEPHNWDKLQYKSDSSTPRATLHRQRKLQHNATPPEAETETEAETEEEETAAVAPSPRARNGGAYAFAGQTVRLTAAHLAEWRRTYHAIPDIIAELRSIDGWFQQHPEKRAAWFHSTSGMLNRKHQAMLAEARTDDGGFSIGGVRMNSPC